MMKRYNFIQFVLSDKLYNGSKDSVLKEFGIHEKREIGLLLDEIIQIGKPKATAMIEICSRSIHYGEETRVYLPLAEISSNTKWFACANALCELLCGEKIWDTKRFIIEKDGASIEALRRTYRFEERFDQMINYLIQKYPGDMEKMKGFSDKVYYLKNTLFRNQYITTTENALFGMCMLGLDEEEIYENMEMKKIHPEWKSYVLEEEFCCIDIGKGIEPIAETSNGGFWMEISWVYCF